MSELLLDPDAALVRGDIRQLTGLRGVAALDVVLTHYGLNVVPGASFLAFGNSAVDLFFCLSSFTLCLVYGAGLPGALKLRPFAVARVARIYPLFIVTTLATLWYSLAWQVDPFPRIPASALMMQLFRQAILLSAVPLPVLGPMGCWDNAAWSVSVEACCYALAFPPLFALTRRAGRLSTSNTVLLMLASGAVCFTVFLKFFTPFINGPFWPQPAHGISLYVPLIRGLSMFAAGWFAYLLYRYHRPAAQAFGSMTDAASVSFVAVLLAERFGLMASAAVVIVSPFLVLGLMNGATLTARLLASPPLHFLGMISYSLYLWHLPVRMLAVRLWPWPDTGASLLHSMAYPIAMALAASALSFFCLEMPARNAIKRLAGRPHVAPPIRLTGGSSA